MGGVKLVRYGFDYVIAAGAYAVSSFSRRSMPSLTPIPACTQITPLVTRVLGQNPGPFTLQGTNTYLVGGGNEKILIDAGEPNVPEYISQLKNALNHGSGDAARIVGIVITHWHHDHVGGVKNVIEEIIGDTVPIYKRKRDDGEDSSLDFTFIEHDHVISVPGATLRFVQTPGHTVDHCCLWLEEENSLFSGDCILGEGTTVFEDLHDYMISLGKIQDLCPTTIYPGHGPVVETPDQKIIEYIAHRLKRENEIMNCLENGATLSSMEITNMVYKETPLAVRLAALNNVKLHLNKLIKDSRITMCGFETYRIV